MTAPPAGHRSTDQRLRGVALTACASLVIVTHDAVTKAITGLVPPVEIVAIRALLALPAILAMAALVSGGRPWRELRPRAPALNALRAAVTAGHSVMIVLSITVMPLLQALALVFLSPLVALPLSRWFLGERAGWQRYACVVAGFGGAALILSPGGTLPGWEALIPLATACSSALVDICTRHARAEAPMSLLAGTMLAQAALGLPVAMVGFAPVPDQAWWALLACGLLQALFHFLSALAFRLADVGTLAPLRYLGLVWAGLLGWLVFAEAPGLQAVLGAMVIVAAGVANVRLSLRGG